MNLRLINGKLENMSIYHVSSNLQMNVDPSKETVQVECMEMVTTANMPEIDALMSKRGRLNISR